MATATKNEVKVWLAGGVVERQFAESVREASKLAREIKRDWNRWSPAAEVTYIGRGGKEVYVR